MTIEATRTVYQTKTRVSTTMKLILPAYKTSDMSTAQLLCISAIQKMRAMFCTASRSSTASRPRLGERGICHAYIPQPHGKKDCERCNSSSTQPQTSQPRCVMTTHDTALQPNATFMLPRTGCWARVGARRLVAGSTVSCRVKLRTEFPWRQMTVRGFA